MGPYKNLINKFQNNTHLLENLLLHFWHSHSSSLSTIAGNFGILAISVPCSFLKWFARLVCLVKLAPQVVQIKGLSKVCCLKCWRKDAFLKLLEQRGQGYFAIIFSVSPILRISFLGVVCKTSWKKHSAWESVVKRHWLQFQKIEEVMCVTGVNWHALSLTWRVTSWDRMNDIPHLGHLKILQR